MVTDGRSEFGISRCGLPPKQFCWQPVTVVRAETSRRSCPYVRTASGDAASSTHVRGSGQSHSSVVVIFCVTARFRVLQPAVENQSHKPCLACIVPEVYPSFRASETSSSEPKGEGVSSLRAVLHYNRDAFFV